MADEHKPYVASNFGGYSEQRLLAVATLALVCYFLLSIVYEAIMVAAAEHFKRLLVVSPLLIVVVVYWLSPVPPSSRYSFAVQDYEPGAIHQAGGSSWSVALVLLLLFFLISYQPSFQRA
ncbi:uncharacterized protein [Aristolochia californica]|uniref:uncharacterized protein n=1 Tax=Aristolochia californica TaxID=171875 RepID=UPI0035DB7065